MAVDKKISQLASGAPAQAGDEYVVARSGANYKLTLTNIAASMPATTITTGNLTFSSTAQRITGDMSNATVANRLMFQTSTTNGATQLRVIPNGTGTTGSIQAGNNNDPANQSVAALNVDSSEVRLASQINGTGTYLPMTFYTGGSERVRIDTSGNTGFGGTAAAFSKLAIAGTLPTSSNLSVGVDVVGTIPIVTTSTFDGVLTRSVTAAASFTLSNLHNFRATQGTLGAGSAVTNQYGFVADSSLTGATNNFGFYSNIASGSNRWNFYAAGTAQNYFAGNTGVGSTPISGVRLTAKGAGTSSAGYSIACYDGNGATAFYVRDDGIIFTGLLTNSPYNATTANAANVELANDGILRRSTSSLRYKSDVTDAAHGLADVLKLRSVTYKGKNDGNKIFGGLIAEEVHDAGLTEFVAYDKEGRPDAIHYGNMVALLVKAVQELTARVAELEAK